MGPIYLEITMQEHICRLDSSTVLWKNHECPLSLLYHSCLLPDEIAHTLMRRAPRPPIVVQHRDDVDDGDEVDKPDARDMHLVTDVEADVEEDVEEDDELPPNTAGGVVNDANVKEGGDAGLPCVVVASSSHTLAPPSSSPSLSQPQISIIMTTYNCVKYLHMAIESIQRQTLRNWEMIIVDDRSTDATDALIRQKAAEDDRIVYLRNCCNVGCYVSKNMAIAHCRGEWITFQDADDHSVRNRLQLQLDFCHTKNLDGCVAPYLTRGELARVWAPAPITLFIRRVVFEERLGSFDTVRFGADTEILHRIQLLRIPYAIMEQHGLYFCLDKWLEVGRRNSLTGFKGSAQGGVTRCKYRQSFSAFHTFAMSSPTLRGQLHYAFPSSQRPFPVHNLTPKERALLVTSPDEVRRMMKNHHHGSELSL